MEVIVLKNSKKIGKYVGQVIIDAIKENPKIVLGLATGSSPVTTYNYLIKDHKKNNTDWSEIKTFNLDEYIGLDQQNPQSYFQFMKNHLFNYVNIKDENINIPIGTGDYEKFAKTYDKKIAEAGGIDIQILGLGENGHIGFNEPPCDFNSKTQVIDLVESTISANSRFFNSIDEVPKRAVSMGIDSIMKAKKILLIAFGENKANAIKQLIQGEISTNVPCTILQKHKNVYVIIDKNIEKLLK